MDLTPVCYGLLGITLMMFAILMALMRIASALEKRT